MATALQVVVGTTATKIAEAVDQQVLVRTAGNVYIGGSDVTSTLGLLVDNTTREFWVNASGALWAIATVSTTINVYRGSG